MVNYMVTLCMADCLSGMYSRLLQAHYFLLPSLNRLFFLLNLFVTAAVSETVQQALIFSIPVMSEGSCLNLALTTWQCVGEEDLQGYVRVTSLLSQ